MPRDSNSKCGDALAHNIALGYQQEIIFFLLKLLANLNEEGEHREQCQCGRRKHLVGKGGGSYTAK